MCAVIGFCGRLRHVLGNDHISPGNSRQRLRRRGKRSVWTGLRGSIRHGRQRLHVELHHVDVDGSEVTVNEASSTTYQKGTSSPSASAIATGEDVLVLGM